MKTLSNYANHPCQTAATVAWSAGEEPLIGGMSGIASELDERLFWLKIDRRVFADIASLLE